MKAILGGRVRGAGGHLERFRGARRGGISGHLGMAKGIEPGARMLKAGCKRWRKQVRHLRRRGSVDYKKLDKSGKNEPYASQGVPDTPTWV